MTGLTADPHRPLQSCQKHLRGGAQDGQHCHGPEELEYLAWSNKQNILEVKVKCYTEVQRATRILDVRDLAAKRRTRKLSETLDSFTKPSIHTGNTVANFPSENRNIVFSKGKKLMTK